MNVFHVKNNLHPVKHVKAELQNIAQKNVTH